MRIIESKEQPRPDRRAHERNAIREPAKIYEIDGGRYVSGETIDASAGGVRVVVESFRELIEGARVLVAVGWNNGVVVPRRDMISSTVVRSVRVDGAKQELALRFDRAIPGIALSAA